MLTGKPQAESVIGPADIAAEFGDARAADGVLFPTVGSLDLGSDPVPQNSNIEAMIELYAAFPSMP